MKPMQFSVRHNALVFDLDGTRVDSAADIGRLLGLALQDCGLEPLQPGVRPPDLHSPLEGIVHGLLAQRHQTCVPVEAVVSAYRTRQERDTYLTSMLYPGVVEFLDRCRQRGQRMAVCTNKQQVDAIRMLDHFGLGGFFSHVVGSDSAANAKPSPDPLLLALDLLEAAPADALMVGDTHVDALCARQSQVDFLWHRNGYGRQEVMDHPRAGSFESFADLD